MHLKPLNENEVHPLPKVEVTLSQLSGATIFSNIDTNSGFWKIPLDPQSLLLTTFLIPFGRYCFNKLSFGIPSAPEHFQRCMTNILVGILDVVCHIKDALIFGKTQKKHDVRLHAVLQAIQKAGMILNREKCQFNKTSSYFISSSHHRHPVNLPRFTENKNHHRDESSNHCNSTEEVSWNDYKSLISILGKKLRYIATTSAPFPSLMKFQ